LFNNPIPGVALVAGTSAFLAAADRPNPKTRTNQPTIREQAKRVAAGAVGLVAGVGVGLVTKNAIVNDLNALGAGATVVTATVDKARKAIRSGHR
jgi:hypothetical protein